VKTPDTIHPMNEIEENEVDNSSQNETFENILVRRMSRRGLMGGIAVASPLVVIPSLLQGCGPNGEGLGENGQLLRKKGFQAIAPNNNDGVTVGEDYDVNLLIRWGDPLFSDTPAWDLNAQSAAKQNRQFGNSPDYLALFPLETDSEGEVKRALLWANHELSFPWCMMPGYTKKFPTKEQVDIDMAMHGGSVVEVVHNGIHGWRYVIDSPYNRRITATTPMEITGPLRGHDWMKTAEDPAGTQVLGMLNNCAGGTTPWGTVLTCEENWDRYFSFRSAMTTPTPELAYLKSVHTRYGVLAGESVRWWENHYARFDLRQNPKEVNRHGYVVEIDPLDPTAAPKKRTAMGRAKRECANTIVAPGGQVAAYSGDDQAFEYIYKFVTAGTFDPNNRAANMDLLDSGTLYAAKFNSDGSGVWLPLVAGQGALASWTPQMVCLNTRGAADLMGATKMDRPEDVEPHPVTRKVYACMTKNPNRGVGTNPGVNAANPRAATLAGHVIEMTEAGDDNAATTFTWQMFMIAGDPSVDTTTYFAGFDPAECSPIGAPDNIAFDNSGNIWLATDGAPDAIDYNDGLYFAPTSGPNRGQLKLFLTTPPLGEPTGPVFTPDNTTLFVSVQHPGQDINSTFDAPASRWPHGDFPRGSVITVTKKVGRGSKVIGT
jgi:secreted PhoX family phosphatase